MDTNDSVRTKPRSTILADLGKAKTARGPADDAETETDAANAPERADPLPRPGDAYLAHARRAAKPQMTLFFVGKDYLPDGYSYANLERVWLEDAVTPGGVPVLKARFYGSVVVEVAMEGRHLHSLCNAIGHHLMPWVWEHPKPKDFTEEAETVIRKISFHYPKA
jgi:hypothetical protein